MRAVVSGMGAVASIGRDADEVFHSLCAGRTGLAPLRGFDRTRYRARSAYEIDDRPAEGVDVPGRASTWLAAAVAEAAGQAGLGDDLSEVPVLVGTGLRELRSLELWWQGQGELSAEGLHFGPVLRERFGATDTHTFSNACSASVYALAVASDLLETGQADTVVVAGVDVLTESMHGLLERVHPVPPERVRPFDRNRTGVLMGDGAAAVVLRAGESGTSGARDTPVLGHLRSVGVNCDAYHATAPDAAGISAAMREAHSLAGVKPADIDLVLLHGTGTLLNDEVEATATRDVFAEHASTPRMTAMKSMTGHTSGASGLMNLVGALQSFAHGLVPPTAGLTDPVDEASSFRMVTGAAEHADVSVAQINAFGFGGINAVAVVEADAAGEHTR
ncbi:beta-ketoacyl-[acyl-carrier-protein] synthase family protein [Saccharomonospora saliphila]|uniref:beta-ketoacyl-[acyl-carrier-protein] synthase family protein n=1 Tax=Saccharomonospora saliphila TaxID=369829 RepID=UPI0003A62D8F|nr:beta-ketoacyl synthase N-terminal-like domain-containing protein [Saccharomonospora saliphila]